MRGRKQTIKVEHFNVLAFGFMRLFLFLRVCTLADLPSGMFNVHMFVVIGEATKRKQKTPRKHRNSFGFHKSVFVSWHVKKKKYEEEKQTLTEIASRAKSFAVFKCRMFCHTHT